MPNSVSTRTPVISLTFQDILYFEEVQFIYRYVQKQSQFSNIVEAQFFKRGDNGLFILKSSIDYPIKMADIYRETDLLKNNLTCLLDRTILISIMTESFSH